MIDRGLAEGASASPGRRTVLERTYRADIRDVWDLWTTKEGLELWWGPGDLVDVVPLKRLGWVQLVDTLPGVEAYHVAHTVEFETLTGGVRMVLTIDPMHSAEATKRAVRGWESEFTKLAKQLGSTASPH